MRTVAVMQPYFFPYAGYYRLFALADCFVILDCVQFPRRGRVHRTAIPGPFGGARWLTLPLQKAPRESPIQAMRFATDARARLRAEYAGIGWMRAQDTPLRRDLRALLDQPPVQLVDFLEHSLRLVASARGFSPQILRSSGMQIPPQIRRQDRILEILRRTGAERYVNSPGGRALYNHEDFAAAGVELRFLPDYAGHFAHMLPALFTRDIAEIRQDILDGAQLMR